MSQPLPRFYATITRHHDERRITRILGESNTSQPPPTTSSATLPGDNRRLRGIPTVARGVAGTSPGTDPLAALIAKQRRWP